MQNGKGRSDAVVWQRDAIYIFEFKMDGSAKEALENGIKVKISSWAKPGANTMMAKAKASANYFNSQMAGYEAHTAGYDEALLLDPQGFIAEGPGECFFIVRNGAIITPPNDTSLESITQATVIEIAKDLGYEVRRERLTRDHAYTADEAFFTGTAAEVTPIAYIDGGKIVDIGVGLTAEAETVIDAEGNLTTASYIDPHLMEF